ncbi:MAG TPA: hypothetical protein VHO25_04540 [Polyangiaceae bacterium]|nr:hypothetical protein [Polyangiaceae bacterium]
MQHEQLSNWVSVCTMGALLLVAPNVRAQEEDAEEQSIEEVMAAGESEPAASEATAAEEPSDAANKNSPVEEDGKTYRFVGLKYRGIIMPQFLLASFLDGAEGQYFGGFGPEFTFRKDGTDITLSALYTDYSMDETRVKGAGDPDYAWSSVSSTLKMMYFTIELLGSQQLKPKWSWYYGGGAGFAVVWGQITRNELTPPFGNAAAPVNTWSYCAAGVEDLYCSGDTPPNYSEPSWFNGGSKPPLFPWLGVQTGVRFKPHRRFVSRVELGLTLTGIFFSLAADYGL